MQILSGSVQPVLGQTTISGTEELLQTLRQMMRVRPLHRLLQKSFSPTDRPSEFFLSEPCSAHQSLHAAELVLQVIEVVSHKRLVGGPAYLLGEFVN